MRQRKNSSINWWRQVSKSPRTPGPPVSDGPATGRKDEPYAVLTMRGRTVHINVLSIAIKGIFILKHDFFPFQFCLTAGFNNASDGPSIKFYDNHSVFLTPPISFRGSFFYVCPLTNFDQCLTLLF